MTASVIFMALLRASGRVALLLSFGVVVYAVIVGLALPANPPASWANAWTHRAALIHTLQVACGATACAMGAGGALAAIYCLLARRMSRVVLLAAAIFAVLTMPSVYGYAALLAGASDFPLFGGLDQFIRTGAPALRRASASIVLAWWLWPIPMLLIMVALRRGGRTLLDVARQDANGLRAGWHGLLPILRGPMMAAAAIVLVLATTEATIAPLFIPQETLWAPEMMAQASLAHGNLVDGISPNAMGFLLRQCWPLVILILVFISIAIWKMREGFAGPMFFQDDDDGLQAAQLGAAKRALTTSIGIVMVVILVGSPLVVFIERLLNDHRYTPVQAFTSVWATARGPLMTSVIVAALVGIFAFAMALSVTRGSAVDSPQGNRRGQSWASNVGTLGITVACLLCATLPTSVIATAMIQVYGGGPWGDPSGWNVYEDTPSAWVAAMLVRFAFIPVVAAWWAARSAPIELLQTARVDGASELQAWIHGCWPYVWRPALVGAAFAAALSMVEAPTSLLVAPARWGNGSLAAYVDQQMHYERHGQTLALTLLLYVPAAVIMAATGFRSVMTKEPFRVRQLRSIE